MNTTEQDILIRASIASDLCVGPPLKLMPVARSLVNKGFLVDDWLPLTFRLTNAGEKFVSRTARNRLVAEGMCIPFFVCAYGVSRHYGGPQEGGWWYDWLRHLEVRKAYDWKQGLKFARELREKYPTCPRGRHSVIGGEDVYIGCFRSLESLPEEDRTVPHYE